MNAPGGTEEVDFKSFSGYLALVIAFARAGRDSACSSACANSPAGVLLIGCVLAFIFLVKGMYILQPNQSALMMLFGSYRGTDYSTGLRWANPFLNKKKVSLRLRNFNSEKLKVNDKRGNPIEIAAAVVWKVSDTARAVLDIDDYEHYVPIQAESALRHLANEYSYDTHDDDQAELTLRARRRRDRRAGSSASCRSASKRRACASKTRASRTSPTRRKSRARCCAGSRRKP